MRQVIADRAAAERMNFFQRVASSSGRVPPINIFDELIGNEGVNRQGMLDADFLSAYNSQKGVPISVFASAGPVFKIKMAKKFTDAGFSLTDVGLGG